MCINNYNWQCEKLRQSRWAHLKEILCGVSNITFKLWIHKFSLFTQHGFAGNRRNMQAIIVYISLTPASIFLGMTLSKFSSDSLMQIFWQQRHNQLFLVHAFTLDAHWSISMLCALAFTNIQNISTLSKVNPYSQIMYICLLDSITVDLHSQIKILTYKINFKII